MTGLKDGGPCYAAAIPGTSRIQLSCDVSSLLPDALTIIYSWSFNSASKYRKRGYLYRFYTPERNHDRK